MPAVLERLMIVCRWKDEGEKEVKSEEVIEIKVIIIFLSDLKKLNQSLLKFIFLIMKELENFKVFLNCQIFHLKNNYLCRYDAFFMNFFF